MPLDGLHLSLGKDGARPFQVISGEHVTMSSGNRFEDFFADDTYVSLKNYLYNYLLRRRAIRQCSFRLLENDLLLEIGSGVSPVMEDSEKTVFTDLSFSALRTLKRIQTGGRFVAADAAHLPFKPRSFAQVICSEVLEHLPDDGQVLQEITAVMHHHGSLILTFPHRNIYFAADDRFVNHFRRYELKEIEDKLREAGLNTIDVKKVLGPLEKITMLSIVLLFSFLRSIRERPTNVPQRTRMRSGVKRLFQWLNLLYCVPIWLDARLSPRCLSTVLLLHATRQNV